MRGWQERVGRYDRIRIERSGGASGLRPRRGGQDHHDVTQSELAYLESQPIGRLATIQKDGSPQVSPIGFRYNAELDCIDIGGFNMSRSAKYRNVARNGRVSLVVDDLASRDPWRVRCLEIHGEAEAVPDPGAQHRAMTVH